MILQFIMTFVNIIICIIIVSTYTITCLLDHKTLQVCKAPAVYATFSSPQSIQEVKKMLFLFIPQIKP
jgi:hypothetical protein